MLDSKGFNVSGVKNQALREFMAEILGTYILVLIGTGSGCQYTLSSQQLSSYLTVNIVSGIGVALGIYIAGNVSGGCVNPAITLAFCLIKITPWRYLPIHWIAQIIGAFLAAATTYGVYKDAIIHFGDRQEFGVHGSAAMFTSFPQSYLTTTSGFFDQLAGQFLILTSILAFIDIRNMQPSKEIIAMLTAMTVLALGGTFGLNSGYPLNPARDFGPRLFLLVAGWNSEVFSYRNYNWFWVPIVGPLTGTIVSTFLYYLFVGFHWPREKEGKEIVEDYINLEISISTTQAPSHGVIILSSPDSHVTVSDNDSTEA